MKQVQAGSETTDSTGRYILQEKRFLHAKSATEKKKDRFHFMIMSSGKQEGEMSELRMFFQVVKQSTL